MMQLLNATLTVAQRDFMKFTRDRTRVMSSLIFPAVFIGVLGGSLESALSGDVGYSFITFIFVATLAQNMFSTTASGLVSLASERDQNFTQELFVAPVPKYIIILGKIIGESSAAFIQLFGITAIGYLLGAQITVPQLISVIPAAFLVGLLGGSFGVLIMANVKSQQAAQQVFQFVFFPQFFLAGIFSPINNLPPILDVLSHMAPLRYAVDLMRGIYYQGMPEYDKVVLASPLFNATVIIGMFIVFLGVGSYMFARNERNR